MNKLIRNSSSVYIRLSWQLILCSHEHLFYFIMMNISITPLMFQQNISKITETAVQLTRIRADLSPARMIYVDTDYLI